jgi:anti-sigma regulatory factor (Ser/Thr protein kinase)
MRDINNARDPTYTVRVWALTFSGRPEEVGRARRWTLDILDGCARADDAALIVSELGANAVVHTNSGRGPGTFEVSLARSDHVITISVTDCGGTATAPRVECPDEEATHGRGLGMVAVLAADVWVDGDQDSRTITAELPIPTSPPAP